MGKIDAVLFDVDGTLLDTVDFIVNAYSHTARMHGFDDVTRDMVVSMGGKGLEDCYTVFAPGRAPAPLAITHRNFQVATTSTVTAYPSALPVISSLRARGIRVAAVTSRRTTAIATLADTGILQLLDAVITGDDVTACKPDPEGLIAALRQLDVAPSRAVMVGDTASDIHAARRAGMRCIGVTYGFYSPHDYAAFPPDAVIDDLALVLDLIDTMP